MTGGETGAGVPGNALVILLPVYNDWEALGKLLGMLDEVLSDHGGEYRVLVVDDGSTAPAGAGFPGQAFTRLGRVDVLELRRNLGHQRAIAVGLAYVERRIPCRAVVVMDSDGEDNPADVPRLLKKFQQEGGKKIIFAARAKRSESWVFRVFYALYKVLHYLLTSKAVRVGNFSVVPAERLASLVVVSEMWSHYAAAVFKSRQPLDMIPTERARRLGGNSRMNFVNLVIHGLSAISVYGDLIGVRMLMLSFALIVLTLAGLGCVVAVRLLTDLAIPGWATFTAGLLLLALSQAVMFSLVFSFIILSDRQGASFLPRRDYAYYVHGVRTEYPKQ
jgi:glycosyltransferase involved in cell wall biosynthesis